MYTSSDQTDLFLECVYLRSQDKLLAIQDTCHRFKDFSPNASVLPAQVEKREIGYCSIRSGCYHLVLYFCPRSAYVPSNEISVGAKEAAHTKRQDRMRSGEPQKCREAGA